MKLLELMGQERGVFHCGARGIFRYPPSSSQGGLRRVIKPNLSCPSPPKAYMQKNISRLLSVLPLAPTPAGGRQRSSPPR